MIVIITFEPVTIGEIIEGLNDHLGNRHPSARCRVVREASREDYIAGLAKLGAKPATILATDKFYWAEMD